jgi:hypothetical protein
MSRIIVEYNPELSKESQKLIRDKVTPSMVSLDETSCQYDITMVLDEIEDMADIILVRVLIEEGVNYIEF